MTITESELTALLRDAAGEVRPDPDALESILGTRRPAHDRGSERRAPEAPKQPRARKTGRRAPRAERTQQAATRPAPKPRSRFLRLVGLAIAGLLVLAAAAAALVAAGIVSVASLIFPQCSDGGWSTSGDGPFDSIPWYAELLIDPDSWSVTSHLDADVDGDIVVDAGSAGSWTLRESDLENADRIEVRYHDGELVVLVGPDIGLMTLVEPPRTVGDLDLSDVQLGGTGTASGDRVRVNSPVDNAGSC